MSRYLFATVPFSGHVNPGVPIARALVERGHEVLWYTGTAQRKTVESSGARFFPFVAARDLSDSDVEKLSPERARLTGLAQLRWDLKHIFTDWMPGMLKDLEEIVLRERVDAFVSDIAVFAGSPFTERARLPWGIFSITAFPLPSRDTAPFGTGIMPSATPLGRLRNRALYWLADNVLFRDVNAYWRSSMIESGVAPLTPVLFNEPLRADLFMHASIPSFEYPRTDLPETVEFIGTFVPPAPADWQPPSWWGDFGSGRKVVLVTQGTIANDYDDLLRPAVRALAERDDLLVVVTTGGRPASELGIGELPANVRVERFIPYAHLMPNVDLVLTNGGYGTIQIAIAHGVPVAAFGNTEEKPEIANRVQWSGLGVGVKKKRATESDVAHAVESILSDPSYRRRAFALQREAAKYDAASRCVTLLERLAGAKAENAA